MHGVLFQGEKGWREGRGEEGRVFSIAYSCNSGEGT
jgi:hypothetical protein